MALVKWILIAIGIAVVLVIFVLICIRLFTILTMGKLKSKRRMDGKTVIITGGNSGIGKETALELARRGAKLILACRNQQYAKEAADEIAKATGNSNIVIKQIDVASLSSVRQFAEQILREEPRVDILINNAGVMNIPSRQLTEDNFELTFASNYLGHFLLTLLLLDLMKRSAPSRIINVSSLLHWLGSSNLQNLNGEQCYCGIKAYCNSKLYQLMFTKILALKLQGTGVTINSVHPGAVNTKLTRTFPSYLNWPLRFGIWLFYKTPTQGAQTTLHMAISEEVESVTGDYYSDCTPAFKRSVVNNIWKGEELFELSKQMTGLAV